jgi:hypothetical protein
LVLACCVAGCLSLSSAWSQQRAPATPLITHDPYFSIWSTTDRLTDSDTTHWTGSPQPIIGIVRIDGKPYRFMGSQPDTIPAMQQTGSSLAPTHTRYQFRQNGVTLELTFFTPAIMDDLDLLSRPVTYLTWSAQATDGVMHEVSLLLDVDPAIAVNDRSQQVVSFRHQTSLLDVLSVGSRDQSILNRSGDNLRIDWGYFHLAVPKDENWKTAILTKLSRPMADSLRTTGSKCLSLPIRQARTWHRSSISVPSARGRSRVISSFLTRKAMQFNICSGICGRTGSVTIWQSGRCSIPPKSDT